MSESREVGGHGGVEAGGVPGGEQVEQRPRSTASSRARSAGSSTSWCAASRASQSATVRAANPAHGASGAAPTERV